MSKKAFPRDALKELTWRSASSINGLQQVRVELVDTSRWSLHYELIFKEGDKFYQSFFQRGATECQDERPYEYASDPIECIEVKPVERLVTVYEAV